MNLIKPDDVCLARECKWIEVFRGGGISVIIRGDQLS